MKILITGCSGFIGSHLLNYLSSNKYQVFCISRTPLCRNTTKPSHFQQDISKKVNLKKIFPNIDCIIHLAAIMGRTVRNLEMFKINTLSTLYLLEYGKEIGIKKFIFASSGAVYGYCTTPFSETSSINPVDFYGLSKYQSELFVNYYSKYFSTVIFRLFFPYGPGQVKGIIPQLTEKIKNKIPIIIYNENCPKINPIYITDVIRVIEKSLSLEGNNYILNICGDEIFSIKKLSLLIGKYLGIKPVFTYIDDKKIKNLIGDNTLMKKVLKINPEVPFEEGIKKYLETVE